MKFILKKITVLIFTIIIFCPLLLSAEETSKKTQYMEEVVVSATRSEIPVFDAPQSVTVISNKEIMDSPFDRIEDILRFAAGFQNYSHYGQQTGGIASHFDMRGVGRNRTLMLLDGVPLNDNFNNSISWVAWGLIPKESIERIEIVRGPSSSLYGSEGLGGVIHIITKKPDEKRASSFKLTTGSEETYSLSMGHSQKISQFGFLLSGGWEKSDGFFMVDPEGIDEYTLRRHRDIYKGFGKATYSLDTKTDLSFSALYYDHEMGKGREYFYDDLQMDQYRLGVNHRGEKMDWNALIYMNRADKTAYQDKFIGSTKTYEPERDEMFPQNEVWGADIQNTIHLFNKTILTSGLSFKRIAMDYDEDYKSNDEDLGATGRQETLSPFFDVTMELLNDKMLLNAGLRYDHIKNFDCRSWETKSDFDTTYNSQTWDNFSPKAGIVFHPDRTSTLRASIGKGFRPPSLFDQYKLHIRSGGAYVRFPNPDLEPEEIVSWDIGGDKLFFDNLWARVAYYQSSASDYIGSKTIKSYEKNGKTYTESVYDNINEVDIYGIEAELEYDIGYGLTSFFNYNYNISEIEKDSENPELEGNYLAGNPVHKFRAGLTYKNPQLINLSLLFKYNIDEYADAENTTKVPDYTTLDISLWKTLFDKATVRLNIENLTDEKEYIEDGTIYYVSMQYDF
ncbi:TonB-dependent receptor plug [Desulfamplus magnetovallimortis]|uniref:TonB-dependent receptor plug n=1 Tax=Desulfamplus magnetovallimortis TaxID=1246637 RepID=A0A1W1HHJ9_9BACT|nr:TonB-dependent receptor [Desulfamplus magnetovallimortis]SLM31895.1 TonB-dependent receptor plug [Desulfamplus magnetovallimortis]